MVIEQLRLPLGQSVAAQVVREACELIGNAQIEPLKQHSLGLIQESGQNRGLWFKGRVRWDGVMIPCRPPSDTLRPMMGRQNKVGGVPPPPSAVSEIHLGLSEDLRFRASLR